MFEINWSKVRDSEDSLRGWVESQLSDLSLPSTIGPLHVVSLSLGEDPPSIELVDICPPSFHERIDGRKSFPQQKAPGNAAPGHPESLTGRNLDAILDSILLLSPEAIPSSSSSSSPSSPVSISSSG
uniref:Mdm12 n=1 Tax=Stygiella incarcerata TaxID=1712417 RepID=A0A192ZI82_9EUKA|nr:Mdm12 [Stygiella incarcerata]